MNVKEIQTKLNVLGYKSGTPDGIIGRMTIAAITEFQKDNNLKIKWPGTIGPLTLAALGLATAIEIAPPWLILAKQKLGLHEKSDNAELRAFLKSDKATLGDPSKLPWCGDFIETIIALTLPKEVLPSNPYWALNWAKFGRAVDVDKPVRGAVASVSRDGGGHVFIVDGHDEKYWHAVGGNQSNSISKVKIAKDRKATLRWPISYPMNQSVLEFSKFSGIITTNEA